MRAGHKGHDLLRSYSSDPLHLTKALRALEGWAISAYAGGKSIFLVQQGAKKSVPDMDTFNALGLTVDKVLHVPDIVFALLPAGSPLKPILV